MRIILLDTSPQSGAVCITLASSLCARTRCPSSPSGSRHFYLNTKSLRTSVKACEIQQEYEPSTAELDVIPLLNLSSLSSPPSTLVHFDVYGHRHCPVFFSYAGRSYHCSFFTLPVPSGTFFGHDSFMQETVVHRPSIWRIKVKSLLNSPHRTHSSSILLCNRSSTCFLVSLLSSLSPSSSLPTLRSLLMIIRWPRPSLRQLWIQRLPLRLTNWADPFISVACHDSDWAC